MTYSRPPPVQRMFTKPHICNNTYTNKLLKLVTVFKDYCRQCGGKLKSFSMKFFTLLFDEMDNIQQIKGIEGAQPLQRFS